MKELDAEIRKANQMRFNSSSKKLENRLAWGANEKRIR